MKEDSSYQQENKFTPKELKDCPECNKPRISFGWCKECETNSMKENFFYWTSGNKEIDELIHYTQLNATQACDYLEWIPFENFELVKYIVKGRFSSVYSALWMEVLDGFGMMSPRGGPINVALKRLENSQNISRSYINQVTIFTS
ncbi:hypothetical protein RclHR1_06160001 [Rhizophagus clarus]|uniref:Uncharacterized protein n=1 Tax=Rhizophagus clarus TaxID=94130 RepID=A0A2Z6S7Q6_9GLOM|nr:hypothetical protein RclHR1_06160001 [Rhizophagus clarus]